MAYRFNPAPGWPAPPEGWTPPEGWQPDPAWPPAPEGWEFWVWQDDAPVEPADEPAPTPPPPVPSPEPPAPTPAPAAPEPAMPAPTPTPPAPEPAMPAPDAGPASTPQPPAPPVKKKGKGLLVALIVLAIMLAAAFGWALVSFLSSDAAPHAEVESVAQEAPSAPPEPVEEAPEPEDPVIVEAEEEEAEPEQVKDLKQLATEAGLLDHYVAQEELEVRPAQMREDAVKLGPSDRAELTTIMVGPGPSVTAQEVGTLEVSEVIRNWQSDDFADEPCPPPAAGKEYIKLTLNANTGPALQDYAFTGLELRFFDDAGNEVGYVNSLLTIVCLGEFGAITSDWARSGGHMGSVLAEVDQAATTLAYSSSWSYGIDDSIYRWELADY